MKSVSYKIIPRYIPTIHIKNKSKDDLVKNISKPQKMSSRYSIDTECISTEYISDGKTVIKLSELVEKLKNYKEINLVPLSLSYNENITEYHYPKENEAFAAVTINVNVNSKSDSMVPSQIICSTEYTKYTYIFRQSLNNFVAKDNVLIQLYPEGKNKNIIEVMIDPESKYDVKEESWYTLIPKSIFGYTKKISIYGLYDKTDHLMYELENDSLQQNQKITVRNYL